MSNFYLKYSPKQSRQNFTKMSDPLTIFSNWCDEFPNYLVVNDPNLINHLTYFDQVLDYYRGNFILCEPYQDFTNKFLTITVPNALSKMVDFPALEPQLFNKVILIFAKYIDLPAQLIIKNISFYRPYSYIPDKIYDKNTNFMISNKDGLNQLQNTVKYYPHSAIIEWIKKSPTIDWDIFHYISNYLLFIQKHIQINDSMNAFLPSFQDLINRAIISPQTIGNKIFRFDLLNLILLLSEEQYQQPFFYSIIYLIIKYITVSTDLNEINKLIDFVIKLQKINNVKTTTIKILHDIQIDKLLSSQSFPIEVIEKANFNFLLQLDENLILKTFKSNTIKDSKDSRFSRIFKLCYMSFILLTQPQKINLLTTFLKNIEDNDSQKMQLLFLFTFLSEKDLIPISLIDNIIEYFYKTNYFILLLQQEISYTVIAIRVLLFLFKHSDKENSVSFLIQFQKKNIEYLSIIDEKEYNQVLLKDDCYSFDFYFLFIILGDHTLTAESFKIAWNQMLANDEKISIFLKYFKKHINFLFSSESLAILIESLKSLNYSTMSQKMIDLFIDFIYIQEKAHEKKESDNLRLQKFDHFGMNELFICYLNTSNPETLTHVKTQLLNLWNNCDISVSAERNEVLSEILLKNVKNEQQYIRCFNFLNDFIRVDENLLLEDIGLAHLRDQKDIINRKTLKLTIVLTKEKQQNQDDTSDSEVLRGTMFFSPSDLCFMIKYRARVKFQCKDLVNGRCFGKLLNMNSTLEMDRITDGSVIQFEYTSRNHISEYDQLRLYMPRMIMNCVPIYQKALDLLHSENLSDNLAKDILQFIYYLPISFQLMSLLDTIDAISTALNNSLNPYERELFLHVLYKSINDEKVKNMLIQNQFYKNLIKLFKEKELNKTGYKRLLSILIKIWPENENEEFINNELHNFIGKMINLMIDKEIKSRKLINICADLMIVINSYEPYKQIINDEIKKNIMNIVNNVQIKIFGKIISHLQNKDEIFNILIPQLDEFISKEDRCPFFFDAIFSSVGNETTNLITISDLALSHLYSHGTSVFYSLCEFINSRPELYSQIDIQRFFDYVEKNNLSPHVYRLINEIYEKVPEKRDEITRVMSDYIFIELPEYNISDNYMVKKNPLGSGIKNLSNTCYINSALQLLFNINSFKVSLLKKENISVDWLQKLQILFAVKNFGDLPFVDPTGFVEKYKMMGEKINISEQQDTSEFLLSIINSLPPDLSSIFGGSLTNSITGIDYTYQSSNNEKFFHLSLDVDGYESLENSLKQFNQCEIVSDYKVSDRNDKIIVKKSSIIQNLPPVLLIQLRRFVYNLKTVNKEKLNSYFSFPFSIDMSNYCATANKSENYVLTGFILHSGKADFGHFHYIGYNKKIQQWVDYNDSITFEYQISNLKNDAFGSNLNNAKDDSLANNQSAYILVYEKANQVDVELKQEDISALLRDEIKAEQIKMKRISSIISNDFYNLAINSIDVQFLYNYFINIMLHLNDTEKCYSVQNKLQNLLKGNKKGIQQVIDLLEVNSIALVTPIICIKNEMILHYYIDFLIFIIKNSENGECYCFVTQFLNCINVFKDNPDKAILFAEIGKEVLKFPDSLIIAQSQKWHYSFLIVLVTIIQNAIKTDKYKYIDIDLFLDDLILMAPIIEKDQKELIITLGKCMNFFKPKTQKLYKDLSFAVSII